MDDTGALNHFPGLVWVISARPWVVSALFLGELIMPILVGR